MLLRATPGFAQELCNNHASSGPPLTHFDARSEARREAAVPAQIWIRERPESGLDRLDSTVFVLTILSRIEDRRRRRRFAPSLTRSSTRTNQHPSDQGRNLLSRKYPSQTWRDGGCT